MITNPYNKYQIEQAWKEASKKFEAKIIAEAKEEDDKLIDMLMLYLPEYNKLREKFYSTPMGQLKHNNLELIKLNKEILELNKTSTIYKQDILKTRIQYEFCKIQSKKDYVASLMKQYDRLSERNEVNDYVYIFKILEENKFQDLINYYIKKNKKSEIPINENEFKKCLFALMKDKKINFKQYYDWCMQAYAGKYGSFKDRALKYERAFIKNTYNHISTFYKKINLSNKINNLQREITLLKQQGDLTKEASYINFNKNEYLPFIEKTYREIKDKLTTYINLKHKIDAKKSIITETKKSIIKILEDNQFNGELICPKSIGYLLKNLSEQQINKTVNYKSIDTQKE